MSIQANIRIISGEIVGFFGTDKTGPLPWIGFYVQIPGIVWNAFGKVQPVKVKEIVVVQGDENIAALRHKIKVGATAFVQGQVVPAYAVAPSTTYRGKVILAYSIQIEEAHGTSEEVSGVPPLRD